MPYGTDTLGGLSVRPGLDPGELDRTDRILLGACAAIWLAALGAMAAAIVALVDLGTAHQESSGEAGTPWLLYIVIAVSAAVIIGAVPLLIRARREAMADAESPARPVPRQAPGRWQESGHGDQLPTEKLRISDTTSGRIHSGPGYAAAVTHSTSLPAPLVAAIDQVWLRCAVLIACAIGIAMVAIGVATYLLAVESDTAAWVFFVLTGLVTVAMPAIPWFYLRELRTLLEGEESL
ncbi:hypothetical protein BST36_14645 [Mycolicibacterium moriokaense]|jgi:hypothetical protein|uniref:DUF2561 family protein n=1 Tax=Mycolicibacterium moriokaense TaxID=39691 RepID=A0AAD1HC43_9MYCO|nr:DUF2561 family protein [Mycolicibacterium moriokaense]MCV7039984.1 DUF2561 family protein [Mycolicibacterium moriokaense]ORB22625.1 hypothetical protein BST36_14645 [Mycolicibacterium moriokaense]BBX02090.1 hypothetical protein MMOR_30260 [Mycolicibacterium moriokaense]